MIWKETNLTPDISPSDQPNTVAILEVFYEEKSSWNPLNGTTDKRNYRTKIDLVRFQQTSSDKIQSWEIPSWALAESAFYHNESGTLFVLHGKNDQYGTLEQRLSIYPKSQAAYSYPAAPENLILFQIAPSPNAESVALITANTNTNWEFSEFELRILNTKSGLVASYPLSFWTALPMYGMRWAKDSETLYVRTPDKVLALAKGKLTEAKSFPNCFTPSTTYGKNAYAESFVEGDKPYKIKLGKKLSEPKMISKLDEIEVCR
ncbi:hypothetical protein [Leptospira idonii]|uniref:Uncharacterized protein n=1 Tax=Leptospira idonii TaxID=1193500 RepID=A0A4R9M0N8_9LEPT|nr:hypothetical protein [Leptospira idonii]TGN19227.1 hypothetical protein EHS15_09930 [Leptospira idonii]